MHREHGAHSNPTCTLGALFALHTFHLSFDLCRAKDMHTCSVLWVSFQYFILKFVNILMQLEKINFKTLETTAHTFFF